MGRTIARVPKCNAIALRTNVQRIYSSLISFTFTLTIECGLIVGGGSSDNVQHIVWILILCIQVYVYGVFQLSARILGYKKIHTFGENLVGGFFLRENPVQMKSIKLWYLQFHLIIYCRFDGLKYDVYGRITLFNKYSGGRISNEKFLSIAILGICHMDYKTLTSWHRFYSIPFIRRHAHETPTSTMCAFQMNEKPSEMKWCYDRFSIITLKTQEFRP